jgi:hypothetical protein
MKKLVLILFVLASVTAVAQVKEPAENIVQNKKMFVVNGVRFEKDIATIPKDSIFFIDTILRKDAINNFPHMQGDVIIVVTKDFAVKQYQEKFSKFSKEYHSYLIAHKADDSGIPYEIDGKYLDGDLIKRIKLLYNLQDRIKSVFFTDNYIDKGVKCVVMNIRTKTN